ncbi:ATP-binding protein [Chelatococcus reniformis]|uniref:ATP-binding protein n=1 Tax=Chelatococcus reniformis TaxID=1494448 RepID=UPI001669B3D2|nr:ATP-binding protein [Chelatococcus reniformis]
MTEASTCALWAADGALLWSSTRGRGLAERLSASSRQRLRQFATTLRPGAVRVERLRFDGASGPVLLACTNRHVQLARGGTGILVEAAASVPASWSKGRPWQSQEAQPPAAPPHRTPIERLRELAGVRPTMRFLWRTNEAGVFVSVSPELEQAVGEASAIVGRTWADLGDAVVDDGAVAAALAGRETWSGRTVRWRVGATTTAVAVELAGVPLAGTSGEIAGQRGFGLIRLGDEAEIAWPSTAPAPQRDSSPGGREAHLYGPPPQVPPARALAGVLDDHAGSRVVPFRPAAPTAVRPDGAPHEAEQRPPGPQPASSIAPSPGARSPSPPARPPARPALSAGDRQALREIARALGARLDEEGPAAPAGADAAAGGRDAPPRIAEQAPRIEQAPAVPDPAPPLPASVAAAAPGTAVKAPPLDAGRAALDRIPLAVMVNRGERVLYANRAFLALARYPGVSAIGEAGLDQVFGGPVMSTSRSARLTLTTADGLRVPVDAEIANLDWQGEPATLISAQPVTAEPADPRVATLRAQLVEQERRAAELTSILDTATDGVILLDASGRILSLNRAAQALFGYDQADVAGESLGFLLAPESHSIALDYLDGLRSSSMASVLNDGREVTGRVRQGGRSPLFMTLGRVGDAAESKFCAVVRDLTAWKKAEGELLESKRFAEKASAQKSDFLAKMSHEIRTPLNAMIGFAEVMLEERFGAIGNERYREYVRGIHESGGHVISLVNDLLDLAKVEAGKLELDFTRVHLNALVTSCVAIMQQQANRERVVLRTSLASRLPAIVADERSLRQVVLNVLANALKFTDAGGQVIISTTQSEIGEVILRVRDTGIGMSQDEVAVALQPFRQLATTRRSGGTGLGLPLTKALTEANRGALAITSAKDEGTLVEIVMPATRVLAE